MVNYSGKQKIAFCKRLGDKWQDLADCCDISVPDQKQWMKGEEARGIWEWLEDRKGLDELVKALNEIDRQDIVEDVFEVSLSKTLTTSPYPGLRAFTENESALFFGRTPEIDVLLDKIRVNRFLAVIGASGSGKSSLVRAGVLPNLKKIAGDRGWEWLHFNPGGMSGDPFVELSTALFRVLEQAGYKSRAMLAQLRRPGNIHALAEKYLAIRSPSDQLVIFIDQFEELFTLVAREHQEPFINLLGEAVQSPYLRIILTVRADFHAQCLNYPALTQLINSGNWNLSTPDRSALRMMIAEPAKAAGL